MNDFKNKLAIGLMLSVFILGGVAVVKDALATVCFPAQGCTGTSTVPTVGQPLVGYPGGVYGPGKFTGTGVQTSTDGTVTITAGSGSGGVTSTGNPQAGWLAVFQSGSSVTGSSSASLSSSTGKAVYQFLGYVSSTENSTPSSTIIQLTVTNTSGSQATYSNYLLVPNLFFTHAGAGSVSSTNIDATGAIRINGDKVSTSSITDTTSLTAGGGTASGSSVIIATTTVSQKFNFVCGSSTCTLTIPPASDYLPSSTVMVASFNTRTGAVTLTSADVTGACTTCITGAAVANNVVLGNGGQNVTSTSYVAVNTSTAVVSIVASTSLQNVSSSGNGTFSGYLSALSAFLTNALGVLSGGTGTSTLPTDSQVLSANGSTPTWKTEVVGAGLTHTTSTTSSTWTVGLNGNAAQNCAGGQFVNSVSATGTTACATASGSGSIGTSTVVTPNTIPYWATSTKDLAGNSNAYYSTSTGGIGIGTSSPAYALQVQALSGQPIAVGINSSSGKPIATFDSTTPSPGDIIWSLAATSSPVATVDTSGNVSSTKGTFTTLTVGSCTGCGAGTTVNSSSSLLDATSTSLTVVSTAATTTIATVTVNSSSVAFAKMNGVVGRVFVDQLSNAAAERTFVTLFLNGLPVASTSFSAQSAGSNSGYYDFTIFNGSAANTFDGTLSATYNGAFWSPGTTYVKAISFASSTYDKGNVSFTPTSTVTVSVGVTPGTNSVSAGLRRTSYWIQTLTQ